jgi:hypothetical protein
MAVYVFDTRLMPFFHFQDNLFNANTNILFFLEKLLVSGGLAGPWKNLWQEKLLNNLIVDIKVFKPI